MFYVLKYNLIIQFQIKYICDHLLFIQWHFIHSYLVDSCGVYFHSIFQHLAAGDLVVQDLPL